MAEIRKTPERMCIGCRQMKNKQDLIRIIRTPEGEVMTDPSGRKNGRGAYLCRDGKDCFERALKSKALQRALKCEIPPGVIDALREELTDGKEP